MEFDFKNIFNSIDLLFFNTIYKEIVYVNGNNHIIFGKYIQVYIERLKSKLIKKPY